MLTQSAISATRRHLRPVKRAAKALGLWPRDKFDDYLAHCRGIIHIGANEGQERDKYAAHGLPVVWIEPIPDVCERLIANIAAHPDQRAIQALITDKDGKVSTLHVSSNHGASSSILDLHLHREIWPEVTFTRDVRLKSSTLPSALQAAGVDPAGYDAIVLDIQGAELLALKGAAPLLQGIHYVQTEAADFEAYKGGATVAEIAAFMGPHGFRLAGKKTTAGRRGLGFYYELLFRRP